MNTQTPDPSRILTFALLAYTQTELVEVDQLMAATGLAVGYRMLRGDLARIDELSCDIAIAAYDGSRDIAQYKNDLGTLKLVRKVPMVIALIREECRDVLEQNKAELAADDLFYLPIKPLLFAKVIRTHAVAVQIEKERIASRLGSGKAVSHLGEMLVQAKIISVLQLKKALEHQKQTGQRLGDALVKLSFIDEEQKMHFLAGQLGVPLATPRQYAGADMNVVALIPENIARRFNCVALEKQENELVVAMTDVLDLRLLDSLRDATELTIKPVLGATEDIKTSIQRFYQDISSHQDASNLVADLSEVEYVESREEEVNLEEVAQAGAEMGIVKLVNMLITNAVRDKASDIHIEPMDKELTVRYRIDGDLRKVMSPPKQSHQAMIARIKILSNLDIAERRLPQDGRMVAKMGQREVDLRVSILPSIFGEKAVMRILDKEAFEKSVSNLGFTPGDNEIFKSQISKPYGMVIVTGPTGSGKSTTLYSAVQTVKSVTKNIITVEDPVEFHMDGVTQVHVNTKIGMTFGIALRSILRQDPDIVLIGEIRDNETADIAIKMALTGHLVFSTLHTNDAASAITRFVDIGIPPLLLASSLNLIIAQRLVRKVCQKCRVEYVPEKELVDQLKIPAGSAPKFYRGEGCVACNGTGYMGRGGIFELLTVSKEIRTMVLRNASSLEIEAQARKEGMKTLRQAGIEMALRGETTIEQVIAATTEL